MPGDAVPARLMGDVRRPEEPERMNNDPSKERPIVKFFLLGCGAITALVSAITAWIAVSPFSGPDAMEISAYHPFREDSMLVERKGARCCDVIQQGVAV